MRTAFRSRNGDFLDVLVPERIENSDNQNIRITCTFAERPKRHIEIALKKADLDQARISLDDLRAAPAFAVPKEISARLKIGFICVRLRKIIELEASVSPE